LNAWIAACASTGTCIRNSQCRGCHGCNLADSQNRYRDRHETSNCHFVEIAESVVIIEQSRRPARVREYAFLLRENTEPGLPLERSQFSEAIETELAEGKIKGALLVPVVGMSVDKILALSTVLSVLANAFIPGLTPS
jgi:hypothetical protein